MRNRYAVPVVILVFAVMVWAISVAEPPGRVDPPTLSFAQRDEGEHWKRVIEQYYAESYRPLNTTAEEDLGMLQSYLGEGYEITKEQVEMLRCCYEQYQLSVAAVVPKQDQGSAIVRPALRLDDGGNYFAELVLSPDGKKIEGMEGPTSTFIAEHVAEE